MSGQARQRGAALRTWRRARGCGRDSRASRNGVRSGGTTARAGCPRGSVAVPAGLPCLYVRVGSSRDECTGRVGGRGAPGSLEMLDEERGNPRRRDGDSQPLVCHAFDAQRYRATALATTPTRTSTLRLGHLGVGGQLARLGSRGRSRGSPSFPPLLSPRNPRLGASP